MASSLTSISTVQAKPGCPAKYKGVVERHMAAMPASHRLPPQDNEVFESLDAFEVRIRNWSFCEGFDVTRAGAGLLKETVVRQ